MEFPHAYVPPEIVFSWVRNHPLPNGRIIPVCVWGEKGVGKTSGIRSYCSSQQMGFRGYHPAHDSSGSDIVGMPMIDPVTERTVYARPMWLPGDDDAVVFERKGIIFIDELNRAPDLVMQGLMEPLGEGTIEHSGWELPRQWSFVCACNPPANGYNVSNLDEAMSNRLLHIPMGFDSVRWAAWAQNNAVHPHLVDFAINQRELIAPETAHLPESVDVDPTPRSIEYLSRLYEVDMDQSLLWTLARGLIGANAAQEFFAHLEKDMWAITEEEVLAGVYAARLQALRSAGRHDLIDVSERLLLATMVKYRPTPAAAEKIAQFLLALGTDRSPDLWQRIHSAAEEWMPVISAATKTMHSQQISE